MNPSDYADRYRNLVVGFDDGDVTVTIERYHIGSADGELSPFGQAVKELIHKEQKKDPSWTLDLIVNGENVSLKSWGEASQHITGPFYGKGSPEDCQIAAQLAVRVKRTTKENLKRYCDTHMGLDCNGFVGNFLFHERAGNPWTKKARDKKDIGPSASMDQFAAAGQPVKDVKAINPANLHLFIEVDSALRVIPGGSAGAGHIVISEPNKYTPTSFVINSFGGLDLGYARQDAYGHPALWAVESTGPQGEVGLKESWYAIKKSVLGRGKINRGVYDVFRGSKAQSLTMEIVALPPA